MEPTFKIIPDRVHSRKDRTLSFRLRVYQGRKYRVTIVEPPVVFQQHYGEPLQGCLSYRLWVVTIFVIVYIRVRKLQ
jgi:hypothetical protein